MQQPKYKEIDTDYAPTSSSRGRGGGGRGRGKRAHHSHSLEDEASLYYVIRNNRSSLTVSELIMNNIKLTREHSCIETFYNTNIICYRLLLMIG